MQTNVETRETDPVTTDNQPVESGIEALPPVPPATLTEAERAQYETLVNRFRKLNDPWVESMEILAEIRDRRLYRERYDSFEDFCQEELGMSRTNVDRQCQTLAIAQLLPTNVAKPEKEAHVRPLLGLKNVDQQIEAYQQAVAEAAEKKKPLTGSMVSRAVREILDAENPGDAAPKPPTKSDVITRITRETTRGLEKLPIDQIEEFEKAVAEFKAAWLSNHPTKDQAAATAVAEKSE